MNSFKKEINRYPSTQYFKKPNPIGSSSVSHKKKQELARQRETWNDGKFNIDLDEAIKFATNMKNIKEDIFNSRVRFSLVDSIAFKADTGNFVKPNSDAARKIQKFISVYGTPRYVQSGNNPIKSVVSSKYSDINDVMAVNMHDESNKFDQLLKIQDLRRRIWDPIRVYAMSAYKCPGFLENVEGAEFVTALPSKVKGGKKCELLIFRLDKRNVNSMHSYYEFVMEDYKYFLPGYICYNLSKLFRLYVDDFIRNPESAPPLQSVLSVGLFSNIFISNALEQVDRSKLNLYFYTPHREDFNFQLISSKMYKDEYLIPLSKAPLKYATFMKNYKSNYVSSTNWYSSTYGFLSIIYEKKHMITDCYINFFINMYRSTAACVTEEDRDGFPYNDEIHGVIRAIYTLMSDEGKVDKSNWAPAGRDKHWYIRTHIERMYLKYGYQTLPNPRIQQIPLCSSCYMMQMVQDNPYKLHCFTLTNELTDEQREQVHKNIKLLRYNMKLSVRYFSAVWFWVEKFFGMTIKKELFEYYYATSRLQYYTKCFYILPNDPTMFSGIKHSLREIAIESTSSMAQASTSLNAIAEDVINRGITHKLDNVLSTLQKKLEAVPDNMLDVVSSDDPIRSMSKFIDSFVLEHVKKFLVSMFGDHILDRVPKISTVNSLLSLFIAKRTNDRAVKLLAYINLIRELKIFNVIYTLCTAYSDYQERTGVFTSGLEDIYALLFEKPVEFFSNIPALIFSFIKILNPSTCAATILKYLKDLSLPMRDIGMISRGIDALPKLFSNLKTVFYHTQYYFCKFFGIKVKSPCYIRVKEKLKSWLAVVDTLTNPVFHNSLVNSECSWKVIVDLEESLNQIMSYAHRNELTNITALNDACRKLTKLKVQISINKGLNPNVIVPFVVHLVGPPAIGKSGICTTIAAKLAQAFKLKPNPYMYNENMNFFDGYAGQEILICDDVNLSKNPDSALWLIKLVSTNLSFLPVAQNEERPCMSNVKLIIMTSNVEYNQSNAVTTTEGIDRRSTFKYKINSPHYSSNMKKMLPTAIKEGVWTPEHNFVRIPSVYNATLDEAKVTYNERDFIKVLVEQGLAHFRDEVQRVKTATNRTPVMDEMVRDHIRIVTTAFDEGIIRTPLDFTELNKMISTTFGIDDEEETISFDELAKLSRETCYNRTKKPAHQIDELDAIEIAWGVDMSSLRNSLHLFARRNNWWPVLSGSRIRFTGVVPEDWEESTALFENNDYMTRFNIGHNMVDFDKRFLSCIDYLPDEREFVMRNYWNVNTQRLEQVSGANYASTVVDKSFIVSIRKFFGYDLVNQLHIFYKWKSIGTMRSLHEENILRWHERLSRWWSNLSRQDIHETLLITTLTSATITVAIATIIQIFDIFSNRETSQIPQVKHGRAGLHTFTSSSKSLSMVQDKIFDNIRAVQFVNSAGIPANFNILFVSGNYALFPFHVFREVNYTVDPVDPNIGRIMIWAPFSQQFVPHTFLIDSITQIPKKDICVVYVNCRPVKSIMSHLSKRYYDCISGTDCILYAKTEIANIANAGHIKNSDPIKKLGNYKFVDEYSHVCKAERGYSGGIIVLDDDRFEGKIIGLQSSKTIFDAHASSIVRSEIQDAINLIKQKTEFCPDIPNTDVQAEFTSSTYKTNVIGETKQTVSINLKTQLRKTKWFDRVIPAIDRVPILSVTPRDEVYDYIDKNEIVEPKPLDHGTLSLIVDEYTHYWKSRLQRNGVLMTNFLNIDQVITGNYYGGKSFDTSTSPGIGVKDWIRNRTLPGSQDFIRLNNDGTYFIHDDVFESVSKLYAQCSLVDVKTSTYASFPKDELRPLGKQVRGIDGAPLEQKILYKMLFGKIDSLISETNYGQYIYGPGINLSSHAGANLYNRMNDQVAMWDFSKFDGSVTSQLYQAVTDFYNKLVPDEHKLARKTLAHITCNASIVAGNIVYQPFKGMRSGFGGTASFNTHIHNILIIYVIKLILKKHYVHNLTLLELLEICDWITYSDDSVFWLKDMNYADILNGTTIGEKLQELGYIVADPDDKSKLPLQWVDKELSLFLQHQPYYDKHLKSGFWRLKMDSISCAMNYYRGGDPFEAIDQIFLHLYAHGPEIYERIRSKFNTAVSHYHKYYTLTWYDKKDVMLKHLEPNSSSNIEPLSLIAL